MAWMTPTQTAPRRRFSCAAVALVLAIGTAACVSSPSNDAEPQTPTEAEQAFLEAAGACVAAQVDVAHTRIVALRDATAQLASSPTDANQTAAREAWLLAADAVQVLEPMQFGPGARSGNPGGEDLRDEIYSWPLTSRCVVEGGLVNKTYETPAFDETLVTARGLDALEYLLFSTSPDNGCNATNVINTSGSWAAIDADDLAARKRAYAARAAASLVAASERLRTGWTGDGSFANELVRAGQEGALFASGAVALNAITDALFYIEKEGKDTKLARPMGLDVGATGTRPDTVESRYALASLRHLRNNLDGAGRILLGCDAEYAGPGLDDVLASRGATELAERVRVAHGAAAIALAAVPTDDLAAALASAGEPLFAAFGAWKDLTDLLKLEIVVALGVRLPATVAGDND